MRYLFFFVHPSKYHLFRVTINRLISKGHQVDVLITSKDVLEDLVSQEKWNYKNIFKEGRKIKSVPAKVSAVINTFRTLKRLNNFIGNKKYDLFVTDDLLTIIGKIKGVPTILFQDDDITAVPESILLLSTATHILAPNCVDFGMYNGKKIGFNGFKASAYLHPNVFSPNKEILKKYDLKEDKFFIIRVVSLTSTHDTGKKGLNNSDIKKLIKLIEPFGKIIITSERKLPKNLEKYRENVKPKDFIDLLPFAKLFISDSQTMSMEAGYLGTPFIRCNDFIGKISYLNEVENKYDLGYGILTKNKKLLFEQIENLMNHKNLKQEWKEKRDAMLNKTVDLSGFMVSLFENFPERFTK
jgi:hypothetical protein